MQRLVKRAAERWPEKVAIIDADRRFTFRELDEASDKLAVTLAEIGIGKGDFVGILAPNCAEFEVAFFGILKAGSTVTTINSSYREIEIADSAKRFGRSGADRRREPRGERLMTGSVL